MNTYLVTYKLFGEYNSVTNTWDAQNGTAVVQANSSKEAISKVQETIGLYVMEYVQK